MEIREDKVLSLLANFRNDSNVNTEKLCKEQIAYNEAQPKKDFAPILKFWMVSVFLYFMLVDEAADDKTAVAESSDAGCVFGLS